MWERLLQGGVFPAAVSAWNQGLNLVLGLELKLAPLIRTRGHLHTGRHQAFIQDPLACAALPVSAYLQ